MNPFLAVLPLFAALLANPTTPRSDPIGAYGLIDKVVLLPDEQKPTQVEIHGTFTVARGYGEYHCAPAVGYLWFEVDDKADECVKQWRELGKHVGTGVPIGFGSRYAHIKDPLQVIAAGMPKPARPNRYSTQSYLGLHKTDGADYGVLRELRLTPKPAAPAPNGVVKVKADRRYLQTKVRLECQNCVAEQKGLTYVFEVETNYGNRFASSPINPGDKVTGWDVELALDVGDQVRWNVRVLGGDSERVPVATASFKVEAE